LEEEEDLAAVEPSVIWLSPWKKKKAMKALLVLVIPGVATGWVQPCLEPAGNQRRHLVGRHAENNGVESLAELSKKVQSHLKKSQELRINLPYGQRPLKINLDLLTWRAKREAKRRRPDEARKLYRTCLEVDQFDGRAWLALSRDAERHLKDSQLAAQYLKEGLERNPDNAHLLQAQGAYYERKGNRRFAMDHYERALRADPTHVASWVSKARLLDRKFRLAYQPPVVEDEDDDVLDDSDSSSDSSSDSPGGVVVLEKYQAKTVRDELDLQKARNCYERALELEPKNERALISAAWFEARTGDVLEARDLYERATLANPGNAYTWTAWAGLEEVYSEDPAVARNLYAKAHAAHRTNTRCLLSWARYEDQLGNVTGALVLLRKATQVKGTYQFLANQGKCRDASVYALLGDLASKRLGNVDAARAAFKRGIQLDPTHPACYLKYAEVEFARGDVEAAKKIIQQGIWGSAGAPVEKALVADLWRFAAKYETQDYDASRAAFRHALSHTTSPADLEDRPHLAVRVFLEWFDYEADVVPEVARRPRAVLVDAVRTLPREEQLWKTLAAYEKELKGYQAAQAILARAKATLGYPISLAWHVDSDYDDRLRSHRRTTWKKRSLGRPRADDSSSDDSSSSSSWGGDYSSSDIFDNNGGDIPPPAYAV